MKQFIFLLFILAFSFENSLSNEYFKTPENIVQLESRLDSLTGLQKAQSLYDLAVEYQKIRIDDKYKDYRSKALEKIRNSAPNQKDALQLTLFGDIYMINGENEIALNYYQKAIALVENSNNKKLMANLQMKMGKVFHNKGTFHWGKFRYGEFLKDKSEKNDWWQLSSNLYQQAIIHYKSAIEILENINVTDKEKAREHQRNIAETYLLLGGTVAAVRDYSTALKYFYKTLEIYEKISDKWNQAYVLTRIGGFYRADINDPEKAIEYCKRSMKIHGKNIDNIVYINDSKLYEGNIATIGFSAYGMGDFQLTLEYYLKMLELAKLTLEEINTADNYNYVGRVYYELLQFDKALEYFSIALELSKKSGIPQRISQTEYNLGLLYYRMGDLSTALSHHLNSLEIREQIQRNISTYTSLNKIGLIYQEVGDFHLAENYLLEALELAIDLKDGHFVKESYKLLSDMFSQYGFYKKALDNYRKYKQINDSLIVVEKSREMAEMQVKYEIESKEKEIIREKEKQLTNTRQKAILIGISGGFLFLVILLTGFIIYQKNRARFTKNLIISEQKAMRTQMNPHFIFNSLGSIQNFILSKNPDIANDYLTSFAKLIRQVLENSKHNTIPLNEEVEALRTYLRLENFRFSNKFETSFIIQDELLNDEVNVPPMLIQPVLENSIKHGLGPKEGQGKLIIDISKQNNQLLKVVVTDNGIGRAKAENINRSRKGHISTGIKNMNERLELINKQYKSSSRLMVVDLFDEQNNPTGTKVEILIPYKN